MSPIKNPSETRERKIAFIAAIIVVAFFANWLYYYYWSFFGMAEYPYNSFLPKSGPFGDYYGSASAWRAAGFESVGYGMAYFPSTFLFLQPFSLIANIDVSAWIFVSLVACFTVAYTFLNVRTRDVAASVRDTVIIALMSYPLLFEVSTGNVEGILFAFLCLFMAAYRRREFRVATAFLAAASSMKLFPAVFLVLYIKDRRWREIAWFAAFVAALSLLPLLIFQGGIFAPGGLPAYLDRLHQSLAMYSNLMIIEVPGMHYGHSLLNGVRAALGPYFPDMHVLAKPYLAFAGLTFLLLSLYVIFVENVLWKRVTVLTIAMCLLPYTSTDYKLLELFIPLFLFINDAEVRGEERLETAYLTIFALLLIPKTPFYVWGDGWASMNTILNPLLMIAMLGLIIWGGLKRRRPVELATPGTERVLSKSFT
jgi:hypothetical protein